MKETRFWCEFDWSKTAENFPLHSSRSRRWQLSKIGRGLKISIFIGETRSILLLLFLRQKEINFCQCQDFLLDHSWYSSLSLLAAALLMCWHNKNANQLGKKCYRAAHHWAFKRKLLSTCSCSSECWCEILFVGCKLHNKGNELHFMLHTKCGFGNRMERKIFTLRRKVTVIFPLRHFSSYKFLLFEYISLSLKLTTFVRLSYENIACQIGDDTKLKTLLWLRWGAKENTEIFAHRYHTCLW